MGKIVVGVDGSAGSRAGLRWAHAEARLRSAPLEVVMAWQFPMMTSLPAFGAMPPPEDLSGEAERALQQALTDEGVTATDDGAGHHHRGRGPVGPRPARCRRATPTCSWSGPGATAGSAGCCSGR